MLKKDPVLKEKIVAFINSFYREERRSPSFQEIGSYFNINKTTAYRYILEMKNEGMVGYDGKSITTSVTSLCNSPAKNNAPICGEIGCGDPTSELENIEEYVNLPESIFGTGELYGCCYCIRQTRSRQRNNNPQDLHSSIQDEGCICGGNDG